MAEAVITGEVQQLDDLFGYKIAQFEIEHNGKNLPFEVRQMITGENNGQKDVALHVVHNGSGVGKINGYLIEADGTPVFRADTTTKEPLTVARGIPYFMARSVAETILQRGFMWHSSTALNLGSQKMYRYIVAENQNEHSPYFKKFAIETVPNTIGTVRQYRIARGT